MKKTIYTLLFLVMCSITFSQNKKEISDIVEEGKKLYKSEMASWFGTDIFLEKHANQREKIGGYFSYTENQISKCIFFSKGTNPKVIGTISFDSTFNIKSATENAIERDFTANEFDIFKIRQSAMSEINSDTLFKTYNNTNLNLIPLIENGEKKVYILTGPINSGVMIFGNDYLLTFDTKNTLINKKPLHKNILPAEYGAKQENGQKQTAGIHSHAPSTGDYITSTDICTLMLYEKFTSWEQYIVVSGKFVSIWNCKTNKLEVLTKEAWEKINGVK